MARPDQTPISIPNSEMGRHIFSTYFDNFKLFNKSLNFRFFFEIAQNMSKLKLFS